MTALKRVKWASHFLPLFDKLVNNIVQIDPQHCYGIIIYKAGALWPYRFIAALYASLLSTYSATFSIETNTPAIDIQVNPGNPKRLFTVHTPRGSITAAHIIHSTDGFAANLLPGLKGKIFPVRGHMTHIIDLGRSICTK